MSSTPWPRLRASRAQGAPRIDQSQVTVHGTDSSQILESPLSSAIHRSGYNDLFSSLMLSRPSWLLVVAERALRCILAPKLYPPSVLPPSVPLPEYVLFPTLPFPFVHPRIQISIHLQLHSDPLHMRQHEKRDKCILYNGLIVSLPVVSRSASASVSSRSGTQATDPR